MRQLTIVLSIGFLFACAPAATPAQIYRESFFLVTDSSIPQPTATPFQPALPTSFPTLSHETFFTPLPPLLLPTATPGMSVELPPSTAAPNIPYPTAVPPPAVVYNGPDLVTFLLIGSDKRPGSSFRTDTMVIAILRPRDRQISLISIPRDLWVYIPDWEMQRINTAYQHGDLSGYPGGGPQLLKDTIEYNLGLHIDHTAMVEFDGFRQIVDTLGGIDLPVSCPYTDWRLIDPTYDPNNENNWYLYTTPTGLVHMDGDFALWYARSRSKSNDFDRGRRQQEVLRAIFERGARAETLIRIPQLYNDFHSLVETDLGLGDILSLASLASQFTNANIRSYYIRPPIVSSWITPGGAYVLLPDQAALQGLIAQALTASNAATVNETLVVQIENGTTNTGWDALAASRLNYAGYETVLRAPDRQDYANSYMIDLTESQVPARSQALLSILGLTNAQLLSLPTPGSPIQYRLVLGYDYQPCFAPESLTQ
ncbi:MAG: Transcriptional regulator LytR [Anaerolineales bacterium]|nr:Transcriptional regulator LytR [Anaerolineales bacterium]